MKIADTSFNFPTRVPGCDSLSSTRLDLFLLMLVFVIQWLSLHYEILILLLSQFPLIFLQLQEGMPYFIAQLIVILVLIVTVFVTIWEIFHEMISLNSVLLLLVLNFVSGSRLKLMCMFVIVNIKGTTLMVFSYFCCYHSSQKSLLSFVPT